MQTSCANPKDNLEINKIFERTSLGSPAQKESFIKYFNSLNTSSLKDYKAKNPLYYYYLARYYFLYQIKNQINDFNISLNLLKKAESIIKNKRSDKLIESSIYYLYSYIYAIRKNSKISKKYALKAYKIAKRYGFSKRESKLLAFQFFTPYKNEKRQSFYSIRKRGAGYFGDYRASYIKGHKHSGLDLKGALNEKVYSISNGIVYNIHLGFPHRTILVAHLSPKGDFFYSVYKHIEDIKVSVSNTIDENGLIGRLFNALESKKAHFIPHIHFEIRKNFDDEGSASWSSKSKTALLKHFYNPYSFMRKLFSKNYQYKRLLKHSFKD